MTPTQETVLDHDSRIGYRGIIADVRRWIADLAHLSELGIIRVFSALPNISLGEVTPDFQTAVEPILDGSCLSPSSVMNDFRRTVPYVTEKGIVLFHDTHPSIKSHLYGSYQACVRLRKLGFDIRHLHRTWWAIWKREWNPDRTLAAETEEVQR